MGWSGDEINLQSRQMNFPTADEHLEQQKVDIILHSLGLMNLLKDWIVWGISKVLFSVISVIWKNKSITGRKLPEVILFSSIAHENLGGFLPDPQNKNKINLFASEVDFPKGNLVKITFNPKGCRYAILSSISPGSCAKWFYKAGLLLLHYSMVERASSWNSQLSRGGGLSFHLFFPGPLADDERNY